MAKKMKFSMKSLVVGGLVIAVVAGLLMYVRLDGFQGATGSGMPMLQLGNMGAAAGSKPAMAAGSKPAMAAGSKPAMAAGSKPAMAAGSR